MTTDPALSIRYSLSYKDFVAAQRLALRRNFVTMPFYLLAVYVSPLIGLVLILFVLIALFSSRGAVAGALLPFTFLCFLFPSILIVSWHVAYRRLGGRRDYSPLMTVRADRATLVNEIDGLGEFSWFWPNVRYIHVSKKVVAISPGKNSFIFIPRNAIADEQIALLQQLRESAPNAN